MPQAFLPTRLIPFGLALDRGARAFLSLQRAYHEPAFGSWRQVRLLATPPLARAVGAALPAVERRQPLLQDRLRRGRGCRDATDPLHAGRVEVGHVLRL